MTELAVAFAEGSARYRADVNHECRPEGIEPDLETIRLAYVGGALGLIACLLEAGRLDPESARELMILADELVRDPA